MNKQTGFVGIGNQAGGWLGDGVAIVHRPIAVEVQHLASRIKSTFDGHDVGLPGSHTIGILLDLCEASWCDH